MGRSILVLLMGALLAASGCTVEKKGIDTASGGDHKRDLAKKLPLDRTVTDSVSAPKGAHTDWKYVEVPAEGTLTLTVSVDNPDVAGNAIVYDELGEPIDRKIINAKEHNYEMQLPVDKGKKYYVRVAVTQYETVYSVGNKFEKKQQAAVIAITTPPPEEPKVVYRRPKPSPSAPAAEPEPEEDPTKIVVTSTIINVVPWKEGKASRITFKQGSDQGIKRGASVAISSGGTCVVKEVFAGTSVCFVDKPTTEFKEGTRVVITSEK